MGDAKEAWDEVGDRFNLVARHLKERYDANAAFSDDDKEKLNDALHQIGDALDAGFTTIGDSFRDPGMRDELKHAGVAIGDALASTFNTVADEIRRATRRE
jgi:hypothetical protein